MEEDIVNRALANGTFGDLEARIVAGWWHEGQWSSLYSLASCGAIDEWTAHEIEGCIGNDRLSNFHLQALQALLGYVNQHGIRGQQPHWNNLHW